MKKILLTLALLLMASAAFAECALYVEDFELSQSELGTEIVVPVKAHFSARLNAWQVDLSLPQGLTAVDATAGEDQVVTYRDSQGNEREKAPYFYGLGSNNRIIAIFTDRGYWQDPNGEDPEAWVPYGQIKWEAGDYDEMVLLHLRPTVNFKGGDIIFNTLVSSTRDSRGGTTLENGDESVHFTRMCHVSVEGVPSTPEPLEVAAPVITPSMNSDYVYVRIEWPASTGTRVYNGEYIYARGEEDAEYEVEAYVQAHGRFAESAHAIETIKVPAKEVAPDPEPDPGSGSTHPSSAPQIVFIDSRGIEHSYTMAMWPEDSSEYSMMLNMLPEIYGENVPFYFMIDGKRYGPETDLQVPVMSDLIESVVRNPIVEGENRWCVPTYNEYWVYTIDLEFSDDEISMIIVVGPITGEDTVEQTEAPVFNGWMLDDAADPSLRNAMFVEITPAEPSTVYYRVQYPDEVWSEWNEYDGVMCFNDEGVYCIEAFALANGKVPSEDVQYWFVISPTISVNEVNGDKAIARVRYFNMAGQEMPEPDGMTIIVTTYTDGTTSTMKVMK
jgi:hypothetical protein